MKLLFQALQPRQAEVLRLVAITAQIRDHQTILHGAFPVPENDLNHALDLAVQQFDAALISLSDRPHPIEVATLAATTESGIQTLVLAHDHRAWRHEAIKPFISRATAIVASPLERIEAEQFGFGATAYLGGPPNWEQFSRIQSAELVGHKPDHKVVMVVGVADAEATNDMIAAVIVSTRQFSVPVQLVIKPSPDEVLSETEAGCRRSILKGVDCLETPQQARELLTTVATTVLATGAPEAIIGAYLRVPLIHWHGKRADQRLGTDWFPATSGACVSVINAQLGNELRALLISEDVRHGLRERQREVYPDPDPDHSAADYILDWVAEHIQAVQTV